MSIAENLVIMDNSDTGKPNSFRTRSSITVLVTSFTLACQFSFATTSAKCADVFNTPVYPGRLVYDLGSGRNKGYVRWDGYNLVRTAYSKNSDLGGYLDEIPIDLLDPNYLKDKTIVDVGSHNGKFIEYLVNKCKEGGFILKNAIAMDIKPSKESPYILKGDFFDSNISESTVDLLFSSWSIFYYEVQNPELLRIAFIKARRILKSDGRLIITPVMPDEMPVYMSIINSIPGLNVTSRSVIAEENESGTKWGFLEIVVNK